MKKRIFAALAVAMLIATVAYATTIRDPMTYTGVVTFTKAPVFSATQITLRGVKYTLPSADGSASQYLQTDGSKTLSWASGTSGSLDDGYNAGATITVDAGALTLDESHATNNGMLLNKTAGSGHALQITNVGTGKDINGTSGLWSITKAGLGTFVGLTATGAANVTGAKFSGGSPLVLEGATIDGTNVNTIAVTDPTGVRTTTLPDASGTVRLLGTATHDYAAAHAAWTLSVSEQAASFVTATNADAGATAQLSAAIPGACFFIYNATGQILTFKVSGQTGGTIASTKRAFYCSDAVDVYEVWEQS
jgi:hypothetical protein